MPTDELNESTYLDLEITAAGNIVEGRYEVDYSAAKFCLRGGHGTFTGSVVNDTLHLTLVGEVLSEDPPGPPTITAVNAFSESSNADTLIIIPGGQPAGCLFDPGFMRMVRQRPPGARH